MPVEPGLVDTNVLVYALDADAAQHASSRALLEAGRAGSVTLYVTSQIICEFYSVVTNPRRVAKPRSYADALAAISSLLGGISSPFLSDIELGRRFPSEEILAKLAGALNVSLEDLKQYDNRELIADLKRLMDSNPKLGFAFRTAVEKVKSGELTAGDIIARLGKPQRKK